MKAASQAYHSLAVKRLDDEKEAEARRDRQETGLRTTLDSALRQQNVPCQHDEFDGSWRILPATRADAA
jgi:hypothetical protein